MRDILKFSSEFFQYVPRIFLKKIGAPLRTKSRVSPPPAVSIMNCFSALPFMVSRNLTYTP